MTKSELNKTPILNREVFEMAPIGMAISNLDGTLVQVNKTFLETIGYSEEELIGNSFTKFTHPDDIELNLKRNKQVVSGKIESHQMEKRFIDKNGDILHAILKVSTLKDGAEKPEYLLAQILDITDKVNLIEHLKSSEKKFREIFEHAAIPMAQASSDGKITNINKAFCRLMEYSKKELIGKPISDISHPEDMSINATKSRELVKNDATKNYSMEKRYISKSGKVINALLKVSYVKGVVSAPSHLLGQIVDITSLKNYEKLLETNNIELTKVNTELDSFIYRASHDLRGPLATMKGLINLIELQDDNNDSVIEGMISSVQKLENTISKLVAFSRNTQAAIDKKEVYIHKIIEESIDLLAYHPNINLVDIRLNLTRETHVSVDISRIKPIFNNLLSNSLTYIDPVKPIKYIDVTCETENNNLVIIIADNGEGMSSETAERAFEMFYRGSDKSTGSGLGLYLVHEVVNKLGGTINISSSLGIGTKVTVILPTVV